MKYKFLFAVTAAVSVFTSGLKASESGFGHYYPGLTASFIDTLPGKPSIGYVNQFLYYGGASGAGRSIPLNGQLALNLKANAYADTSAILWETPLKIWGGNYAAVIAIPYVWQEIKVDALTNRYGKQTTSSTDGVGDIYVMPASLGFKNGDFKWDARFGFYAPTGEYNSNSLANVGLNYWTFEPEVTFSWLSSKIGTEVSAFAGLDFNTKNTATDYQSGDIFHFDMTVAQHFPLAGGFGGVGFNTWIWQQITPDSGSGAKLGGFETSNAGIGPVLSYAHGVGKSQIAIEAKWLPQLETTNTTKGNYVWVKVAYLF